MNSVLIKPINNIEAKVTVPGSKSITNRALIIAALASGTTTLINPLFSEDTLVLINALNALGVSIEKKDKNLIIQGIKGQFEAYSNPINLNNSGTSIRFLTAALTLGQGSYTLDGNERMRQRPIGDLIDALQKIGISIKYLEKENYPPIELQANGFPGGAINVDSSISSQYLSALLLVSPYGKERVTIGLNKKTVSRPYINMTVDMMESFGVTMMNSPDSFNIGPQIYQGIDYEIEPDASNASYFFAAAAITGGNVLVPGLFFDSIQGDTRFVSILGKMGAGVTETDEGILVQGKELHGISVDMNAMPDMVQTLACTAVFADSPTTIINVGNLVYKETDRLSAIYNELTQLGVKVERLEEGLKIHPGLKQGGKIKTYDDHRMAMSFSLLGLKQEGIEILDPECVNKTCPDYFEILNQLYT